MSFNYFPSKFTKQCLNGNINCNDLIVSKQKVFVGFLFTRNIRSRKNEKNT